MSTATAETVTAADLLPELATTAAAPAPAPESGAVAETPTAPPPVGDAVPFAEGKTIIPGITCDRRGVRFDPEKHLPRVNSKTQNWMPRPPKGVRKKRYAAAPADVAPAPAAASVESLPPIPEVGPEADPIDAEAEVVSPAPGGGEPAGDARLDPKRAAEVGANAIYFAVGAATGDHKAARATGEEHKGIVETAAAYMEFRGVRFVGVAALVLLLCAYVLDEKRRVLIWEAIRKGVPKKAPAAPVRVVSDPPAAAPPPSPAMAHAHDPFAGMRL